jgi:hypothetical protein
MRKAATAPQQPFPKTIDAAGAFDRTDKSMSDALWALGDALIAECGEPAGVGTNNGSEKKLRQAAAELKRLNLPHSLIWLRKARSCAHRYPDYKRLSSVSWSVHDIIGDPATLADVAQKRNEKLTAKDAREFKKLQREQRKDKERRDHAALSGREPTNPALENAKERFRKAAAKAKELTNDAKAAIAPHVEGLSAAERTELFGFATDAQHAWAEVARIVEPVEPPTELPKVAE